MSTPTHDDGGPAFPLPVFFDPNTGSAHSAGEWKEYMERRDYGMSLRDYFAGQVLPEALRQWPDSAYADVARWSYDYADAMLQARRQKGTP